MPDDRTIYTITDEEDNRTTITLDKFIADILQEYLPDVHARVRATYERVAEKKSHLSRREKGDVVRILASNKILECPGGKERGGPTQLDSFFGFLSVALRVMPPVFLAAK